MELFKSLENRIKLFKDTFKHFEINEPLTQSAVDEICNAVEFFMKNSSITGQIIAIDSGQSLNWQTPDVIGSKE